MDPEAARVCRGNGEPSACGSDETPDLSRGSFLPLLRIRSAAFALPPARAVASFASTSATSSSMALDLAVNSGDDVEMREGSTEA